MLSRLRARGIASCPFARLIWAVPSSDIDGAWQDLADIKANSLDILHYDTNHRGIIERPFIDDTSRRISRDHNETMIHLS